ncbi:MULTISPECIES: hypothetical protein [Acinetobacter]|uniref:hypothetical protein n=1 Tax=Acinetobacter TaxID=469 RepID=UPI001F055C24|nr:MULTISPECIES: hypothetical protein [Acinetobacter]MCH2003644.1 hypothetical protein [Acinetobacter seifertii]WQF74926.1 hypothetical protein OKW95_19515 [Acinetobacter oleivorans]
MASRITKTLTYNLNDRGRLYGGQDRSNVDMKAMINKINSPEIQEQVDSGFLNGFCGHQIRQRWGMIPPESIEIDGKIIYLEPALRTVSIKAFDDATVEHRQEFFENVAGEHVMRQYKAKVGGFSTAVNYFINGPILTPNIFGGVDYVFSPNYVDNASIGLFDSSTANEVLPIIHKMLETEIVALYDSMHSSNQDYEYMQAMSKRARAAERELERLKKQTARRVQKTQQITLDQYDSSLYSNTLNFDQQFEEARSFLSIPIAESEKNKTQPEKQADQMMSKFGGFLGIR